MEVSSILFTVIFILLHVGNVRVLVELTESLPSCFPIKQIILLVSIKLWMGFGAALSLQ